MLTAIPLSLYIHIPWCVQKCPYCDFNSHALKNTIPEQEYVKALIEDLDNDIATFKLNRPLHSIFIGGGTPSLFSSEAMTSLLSQVLARFDYAPDMEITLEANPGTVEADKFVGFAEAGINRLSLGIQSFANDKLIQLGRIHDAEQAKVAANIAANCGIKSFNLDLMHGLPNQSIEQALHDLDIAISLNPAHISWYQLTIEPNTVFYSKPPTLPPDDDLWQIQELGLEKLTAAGYQQYEISGYSKQGFQCQHNLNYWQFGDYIGIGCGAHGKITEPTTKEITRTVKVKHPKGYLDSSRPYLDKANKVTADELPFEYLMNLLRLAQPFSLTDFENRTGLSARTIEPALKLAQSKKLMVVVNQQWQATALGHRYLNDLLTLFL